MPVTLRVAFTILSTVTVLVFFLSLVVAPFMWYWGGGWLSVLPFVPVVVYATITVLVMRRKSWARYATLLFPLPLALTFRRQLPRSGSSGPASRPSPSPARQSC